MSTAVPAGAGAPPLVQTIVPDTDSPGEFFGSALAVDGETLVVGAPYSNNLGFNSGVAYVFELRSGVWTQTARLVPSDSTREDMFGLTVAIDGSVLVVSASRGGRDSERPTAVYLFERQGEGWVEVQRLPGESEAPGSYFGTRLALAGSRLAVQGRGGIHIFRRRPAGWIPETVLSNHTIVDLRRRSLLATSHDRFPAITLFKRRGAAWSERDTLEPPPEWCSWGEAISRSGKLLTVTDPIGLSCSTPLQATAYVYRRTAAGWVEEERLQPTTSPSSGEPLKLFGRAVSLRGKYLVAAANEAPPLRRPGIVLAYHRSGGRWLEMGALEMRRGRALFGAAVAVGKQHIFVSTPGKRPGRISVYALEE